MRKILMSFAILVGSALFLQSCKSSQNMVQSSNTLQGEWNIVEIDGSSLVPADHQPFPYMGFNTSLKSVYGTSGCNRIMGGYESPKAGKISFSKMGMTLMMCPDMDIENRVTKMIDQVQSYKFLNSNQLAFYGKGSKPIAILDKRELKEDIVKLDGSWVVEDINGEPITTKGAIPTLGLDVATQKVSGNAGCNRIIGGYKVIDGVTHSITFPNLGVTRMMCDNMALENQVLAALGAVYSYDLLPSGVVLYFYDAEGAELMKLVKDDKVADVEIAE